MRQLILFISFSILTACNSVDKTEDSNSWTKLNEDMWPQIVLTNSIEFEGRERASGASSFLICGANDTFACTAKHLLGDAMGITPEVPIDSVNVLLKAWNMYPRNNDTVNPVIINKLVTLDKNEKDILLFTIKNTDKRIQLLKPYFETLKNGEMVKIPGCEYSDSDCNQKIFNAEVAGYKDSQLILVSKYKFNPAGFSGAPVLHSNGKVIGLISGAVEIKGMMYLSIEPISSVSKYLE